MHDQGEHADHLGMTFITMFIIFCGAVVTSFILYIYLNHGGPGSSYGEHYRIIGQLRTSLAIRSLAVYVASSLFIMAGVGLISLIYSHRIAGPVYRIRLFISSISKGDVSDDVKLRKNDLMTPLACELNSVNGYYRNLLHLLKMRSGELISCCEKDLSTVHPARETEAIIKKAEELRDAIAKIKV